MATTVQKLASQSAAILSRFLKARMGYEASGNYMLSTRLQKIIQTGLLACPVVVLILLPYGTVWLPGRTGLFDWQMRSFQGQPKARQISTRKRRMVRGPSVFFDCEEFKNRYPGLLGAELQPDDSLWGHYEQWCQRRPLLTKSLTAAILAVLGDVFVQYIRTRQQRQELVGLSVAALAEMKSSLQRGIFPLHRMEQTAAFALHGLIISGPLGHCWHWFLEWVCGSKGGALGLGLRLILDRLVYDPIHLLSTLFLLGRLTSGPSLTSILQRGGSFLGGAPSGQVFWVALFANYRVWIPAQLLNYAAVPRHLRVLFSNVVSMGWNYALAIRAMRGMIAH